MNTRTIRAREVQSPDSSYSWIAGMDSGIQPEKTGGVDIAYRRK